jgi:hypothetical protein
MYAPLVLKTAAACAAQMSAFIFISLNQFSLHGRGALRERIVAALVLFEGSTVVAAFCATKG